eukprot:6362284-Amphidinium_carterae.1
MLSLACLAFWYSDAVFLCHTRAVAKLMRVLWQFASCCAELMKDLSAKSQIACGGRPGSTSHTPPLKTAPTPWDLFVIPSF